MTKEILIMFSLTMLQNASFTLVSRARNSNSLLFHTISSLISNGIYLLVIQQVVTNFKNLPILITYLVGSVTGSVLMHYFSMKYIEKFKIFKK
jgi:uncharacterized membrane protein YfcA